MTTESLATVFSPNLLRSTNSDVGTFFSNMAAGHRVTKMLIAHVSFGSHTKSTKTLIKRSGSSMSSSTTTSSRSKMQTRMRSKRLRSATSTSPYLKRTKRKRTSSGTPSMSCRPNSHPNRPCSTSTSGARRRCPSTCLSRLLLYPRAWAPEYHTLCSPYLGVLATFPLPLCSPDASRTVPPCSHL